LTAPRKLGSYVIDSEIGRGGMGVVYRARDPHLDRWVAIKTLPPELLGDLDLLARFEREARILASLHHPGIAGIHAFDVSDGVRFFALEYVDGPTLAERIAAGPLPVSETLEIARQLATAIEAAHECGVTHRDLKPGNIKLGAGGEVKVLDFGLARIESPFHRDGDSSRSPTHVAAATRAGAILGTAAYMSPEQARGLALDRRTDIWSFGCVVYECLTGVQAFGGDTISDSIAAILEHEPDWSRLPADTPAPVVDLLERCLAKDARHRLRDIGDARLTLERALATRSPSGRFPTARIAGGRRRVSRVTVGAAIGAVIGTALGGLVAPRMLHRATPLRSLAIAMPPGVAVRGSLVTPDGGTIVVNAVPRNAADAESAAPRFLVRSIGSAEFRQLPQSVDAQASALAEDGHSLLMVLPVAGTTQRRLVRAPLDGSTPPTPVADWHESWNSFAALPGGDVLAIDGTTRLVRIPAAGGAPSPPKPIVVTGDAKLSQVELTPSRLPNGAPIVNVIVYDARGWHYNVGILDPASGKVTIVVEDGGNGWYWSRSDVLLFARGRSIFAARFDRGRLRVREAPIAVWTGLRTASTRPGFFRVLDDGTLYHAPGGSEEGRTLATLESSGTVVPLAGERRTFDDQPAIAPDGHRFACTIANGRGIDEVWIGDVTRPGLTRLGTDPEADCSQPVWSHDGERIAYKRQAQDSLDGLYVVSASGGTARRVLVPESGQVLYRAQCWLNDGSALIATRQSASRVSLVRVPVTNGVTPASDVKPLHESRANDNSPRLSPDGRTLAYLSDATGRIELYVASLDAGGTLGTPVQLSSDGAFGCRWAFDGRSVFAVDAQNRIVEFRVPPGSGAPVPHYDLRQLNIGSWAPLPGRRFLVYLRTEDEGEITAYDLVEGWMGEVERILKRK
jgi:hypothetical protein